MPDVSRSNTLVASAPHGMRSLKALTALFEFAVGSHRRAASVLLLTSLIAFLPGVFEIPPIDRDEAYLSQSSKEMMEGATMWTFATNTMLTTPSPLVFTGSKWPQ